MSSQISTTSSIPTDIFNEDFVSELDEVDILYFANNECQQYEISYNNSDSSSESDSDSDVSCPNILQSVENIQPVENSSSASEKSVCHCKRLYGKPCHLEIDSQKLSEYRFSCLEKPKDILDIIVKAQLIHNTNESELTEGIGHTGKERQKSRINYKLFGKSVCRETFSYAHGIDRKTVDSIAKDILCNGLEPRNHGNKHKQPKHALSMGDVCDIKQFLIEYSKHNGVPVPGRLPNCKKENCTLLPSDNSKADIHQLYNEAATLSNKRTVSLTSFKSIWNQQCPYLLIMKPSTDLCQKCQKHSYLITNSANISEEEKIERIQSYENHVKTVKVERDYYRQQCEESASTFQSLSCKDRGIKNVLVTL